MSTEATQALQEFTLAVFDTVREPLLMVDADLRVVAANRAFYGTFQVAPEETIGTPLYGLGNGQWDIPRLRDLLEHVLPESSTIEDFPVHHVFEHIGRRSMLLNARKLYRPGNHAETILLAIEDVTEREDAQRRLWEAEKPFRLMVENAREYAIFMTDREGRILTWNPGAERIFGWTEEEALGQPGHLIFTPEDLAAGRPEEEMAVAGAEGASEDTRWHVKKDGSRFWASGVMTAVWEDDGTLRGFAKILRDNTERKRVEDERDALNAALRERNEEMEQFAYTVSHDLKSPLVTVTGFIGLLESHLAAGREELVHPTLERIRRAADRMGRLIDDLLGLSRIGRTRGELVLVDVGALVAQIGEEMHQRLGQARCTLVVEPDLPPVCADRDRLAEVFENLLSNAIRYGCGGGGAEVRVGGRTVDGEVRYFVRDDGPGIAPEYHQKVFGLFQRLETGPGGTGVGLAIVAKIMRVHGGRAWVESGDGHGAVFWIAFQASGHPPHAAPAPRP